MESQAKPKPLDRRNTFITILTLFLVIIIDQMGITFIFPILTPLFMDPHSTLLSATTSTETRDYLYSFTLAIYPFMMFIGAPILGSLSDQVGRKKILLVCLIGCAGSFYLSAIAIGFQSLLLLILSRGIAGFFSGSQYISQAAIADISSPERKAINLSYIIIAISVGMVFGPLLGGFFSDPNFAKWLSFQTPFQIAAFLSMINAILLWAVFRETFTDKSDVKLSLFSGVYLLKEAIISPKINMLSLVLFFLMLGWTLYFQSISLFLYQHFQFSASEIGTFIGFLGIGFALALTIVLRLLINFFKTPTHIIIGMLLVDTIAVTMTFAFPHRLAEWIAGPFIIGAMAIAYTLLLTIFSNIVDAKKQGWIMGVTGAIVAIAWTISGLIAGPLGYINIFMPLIISACIMAMALITMIIFTSKTNLSYNIS